MSLKDKIISLESDNAYYNLIERFETATGLILSGAGDDQEWLDLFNQVRNYEYAKITG